MTGERLEELRKLALDMDGPEGEAMRELVEAVEKCRESVAGGLELIDADDLLSELCSRYDAAVFLYMRDLDEQHYATNYWFSGPGPSIVGMLEYAKEHRLRQMMKDHE